MTAAQEIAKRLRSRELEVEDILALVNVPANEVAALRVLERNIAPAREGEVPYRAWLNSVCVFLEQGYTGLLSLATARDQLPFVLGVLEELATPEALSVLSTLRVDYADALELARTMNDMLLAGVRPPSTQVADSLRAVLHGLLDRPRADPAYGMSMYALRAVGDRETLEILKRKPPPLGAFANAKGLALRAIRARQA